MHSVVASERTDVLGTRAVRRPIEAGHSAVCIGCDEPVKFAARHKAHRVIANIYVDEHGNDLAHGVEGGAWQRVEHWHEDCYERAGNPRGPIAGKQEVKA
jgi:hypothetical protein